MARTIDYEAAQALLLAVFSETEAGFGSGILPPVPDAVVRAITPLIDSSTQAYREVLVGCCLARMIDPAIDVRLPYVGQGDNAYNGRTLDENVVNRFLQSNQIPASRGPVSGTRSAMMPCWHTWMWLPGRMPGPLAPVSFIF